VFPNTTETVFLDVDLGLIPFERLPLQCTLLFSPPDAPALKAYLQHIGELEDVPLVADSYLCDLTDSATFHHPSDAILQQPLSPLSLRQVKGIDLRMAIMQFQLDAKGQKTAPQGTLTGACSVDPSTHAVDAALEWKKNRRAVEVRSVVDAYMTFKSDIIAEVSTYGTTDFTPPLS
jgi:hypothetical protein